jgi:TetR/AcrR family transcriptional regulator, cholesterol catabolism regulator
LRIGGPYLSERSVGVVYWGGEMDLMELAMGDAMENGRRDIPTLVKDDSLVAERRRGIVEAAVGLFVRKGYHATTTREIARAAGVSNGLLYEYVPSKEDLLYLVCDSIHGEMESRLREAAGIGDEPFSGNGDAQVNEFERGIGRDSAGIAGADGGKTEHENAYEDENENNAETARDGATALREAIARYIEVCDRMQDSILLIYRETASLSEESRRYVLRNEARIAGLFESILERGVADGSLRVRERSRVPLIAHTIAVLGHMWAFRRWALRGVYSLEDYTREQTAMVMGLCE